MPRPFRNRSKMLRALLLLLLAFKCATDAKTLTKDQIPLCKAVDGLRSLAQQLQVEGSADKVAAAAQLYLWGAPLLPMAESLWSTGVQTNAINSLYSIPVLLTPQTQFKYNIVASNSDTLYTVAFLDLSRGPVVLTSGASNGRFYTMELLDFYTEVFGNPGIATTGDQASKFVVMRCGGDKSKLPATLQSGVTAYFCSNTSIVWLIGRTFVKGQADLPAAQAMQASLKAFPVDAQGKATAAVPAVQTAAASTAKEATALLKEAGWSINNVSKVEPMFRAMMGLAQAWPPTSDTSGPLKAATELGLDPAKGFNQPALNPQQKQVLESGYAVAQACINAYSDLTVSGKALQYGWGFADVVGNYGTNYLMRAVAAYIGLGANWANVTIYPATYVDKDGALLSGANGNTYTWTIDEKALPPTKYFSSLIIYNYTNKMIPVVQDAPRWRVNYPADQGDFAKNSDGSVTLWLSYAPPGPKGSPKYQNWLPLSDGRSWAMLRMYGPSPEAVAGGYQPPPIVKVKQDGQQVQSG